MKRIWLLVADASRASVLACGPRLDKPQVIRTFDHPEGRLRDKDLVSDDTGRTRPRARNVTSGSALPHSTSPHDVTAEKFSRELASFVRKAHGDGEYDELIVVAPPTFLGLLRRALGETVLGSVREAVAKDYTADPPETVVRKVREHLDLP